MGEENQGQGNTMAMEPAGEKKPALKNIVFDHGIIPKDYEDVMRFAGLVHASGLAPKSFDTAPKVAIGILTNMEIGRPVITGLQDLAIINGRCGLYGDAITGQILASGLMEEGYPKETETGTPFEDDWTFTYTVKRRGRPEKTGRWTWMECKRAGYDDPKKRDGSRDPYSPWRRFTRRMMQWKARQFVNRDEFGDVLRGMKAVEELADIIEVEEETRGSGTYSMPGTAAEVNTTTLAEKLKGAEVLEPERKDPPTRTAPPAEEKKTEPAAAKPSAGEEPEIKPPGKPPKRYRRNEFETEGGLVIKTCGIEPKVIREIKKAEAATPGGTKIVDRKLTEIGGKDLTFLRKEEAISLLWALKDARGAASEPPASGGNGGGESSAPKYIACPKRKGGARVNVRVCKEGKCGEAEKCQPFHDWLKHVGADMEKDENDHKESSGSTGEPPEDIQELDKEMAGSNGDVELPEDIQELDKGLQGKVPENVICPEREGFEVAWESCKTKCDLGGPPKGDGSCEKYKEYSQMEDAL